MTSGGKKSSSASSTSQTATSATDNTSQTASTSAAAQAAQSSMNRSIQALQAIQSAQSAARSAAIAGANNLGLDPGNPGQTLPNVPDGLGVGGLNPLGGATVSSNGSTLQLIDLGNSNNGTLSLGKGGKVILPTGTPGNDTVSITGAGSLTSSGGSVTATAGSLTTSSGGTLSTTAGGSVVVTGGSSTLTTVSATNITSAVAGTVTLAGGGTAALPANTAVTVPAGSTISFSGTASDQVDISGTATVTLKGAGTLALAGSAASGAGGTITSNSGTVSFTDGLTSSLPAGTAITLNGAGSVNFGTGTGGAVPVLIGKTIATNTPNPAENFTTNGTVLDSTGYQVPNSWINVSGLTQSVNSTTSKVTDTVTQDAQQAILYWNTFNIGKNTTLSFDQSAGGVSVGQWVAINQILDPSLSPSQILGAIQGPGQVYVINPNGIIFGGSSQINLGALTASTLALNPAYIQNGLLNDAGNDFEFQFSSLFDTVTALTGTRGHQVLTTTVQPLWTAPPVPAAGGSVTVYSEHTGDITVQAGAQLSSPTNAQNQGGRIALIAPNVTNHGTISTPDGQTILAAGLQVGLAAHNADDPSLRGLDVYVGQVTAPGGSLPTGTFTFDGLPGTVTIAGVQQNNLLTFAGSGTVGSYVGPDGTTNPLTAGTPTAIPVGSTVTLASGAPSYAAIAPGAAGIATNAGNTLDAGGNITNPGGDIEAPRADVTITGQTVNQLGFINGSTSVTLNGRIDLLADYNATAGTTGTTSSFFSFATGDVNFGPQSVTQILPELSSTETTIGTTLAISSIVDVQGLSIDMASNSLLYAPGANQPSSSSSAALDLAGEQLSSGVTFNAGSWFTIGATAGFQTSTFSNSTGTISLDDGAVIDVSGSQNVSASVAENIIPVELRGPELANSALQRNGGLRGDTVYIDIRDAGVNNGTPWIGTPIGDVSGYVNDVQRTVGELTTDGGTVALKAGSSVGINSGATVNVSGGWINYTGANVQTTVVKSGGQLINISQATPNLVYEGVYNGLSLISPKWGVTQNFLNSLLTSSQYDAGYVQGGNGGKVSISSPAMTLQGNLYGNTVSGAFQQTPVSVLNSTYAGASFLPTTLKLLGVPDAGTLDLSFLQAKVGSNIDVYQATSPDVEFETDAFISQNAPVANQLLLSQDLVNNDGFGNLNIDTSASGTITVPAGVSMTTSPGGLLSFTAANIDIEGSLAAPGGGSTGGLDFKVFDIAPTFAVGQTTPADNTTRGQFTLGPDASLSSTGLLVDDRATAANPNTLPQATAGGTINISALDVNLEQGSTIDVSGGLAVSNAGKETFGNAGSISILAGQDPSPQLSALVSGGQLLLGATLTGYSGNVGGGGSLTIQSPLLQIGGSALLNGDSSTSAFVPGESSVSSNGTTLWIDRAGSQGPDFFSEGGFGSFNLEGLGQLKTNAGAVVFDANGNPVVDPAVLIAANTTINPTVLGYTAALGGNNAFSLAPLTSSQEAVLLPSQRTPVNLTLNAEGVSSPLSGDAPPLAGGGTFNTDGAGGLIVRGDLDLQAGSKIITGPQTNASHGVSLQAAHGFATILGSVSAPGGTINIKGGSTAGGTSNDLLIFNSSVTEPFVTVDLGPSSALSTAGTTELTVNSLGATTGSVLPGGAINISGNIAAESGAVLDVSGASGLLDESSATLGLGATNLSNLGLKATRVDSNAGSIAFNASQLFYSDATLLGAAGGATAQGGSLSLSVGFSEPSNPNNPIPSPGDVSIIVSQQGLDGGFSLPSGITSGSMVGLTIPGADTAVGATVNNALAGEPVYGYFAANPNLFATSAADAAASDNGGRAGGFSSLNLAGTLDFIGPVQIDAGRSITLATSSGTPASGATGGVIYADSAVVITAPYISLNGYETSLFPDISGPYPAATAGSGTLTVNASTLADVGNLSLENIGTLNFNSTSSVAGDIRGDGTLSVAGQINLNAAQIYPPTAETFTIAADAVSITAPTGSATPFLPLSGGGTLNIFATTIEQSGVLRAPFGIINLGNSSTQSITFGAGSITSVSGVDPRTGLGITVPYGIVDQNGSWFDPNGNNITLAGPPAKAVNVVGQNIDIQTGSTIDLTGGGNLLGYQFNSGTGGTNDILASSGSFAVIPGYSFNYAPDGAYADSSNLVTNNAQDTGYFNSDLGVGEQIYLNSSSGLPAGTYTLLPARYALLPGAFLVTPESGSAPGTSVSQPDGTTVVSGYVTSGLNPTTPAIDTAFQVAPQSYVLNNAPYTVELANTYFPQSAASGNVSVPRLPIDSGQLVLNATGTMSIEGTLLSQAGAGGQGGEVDIASSEDIYILGPDSANSAPAGALVLDSSQLTDFGAASLLIGGFRTTTDGGTSVTVTTDNLVVDNSGATTTLDGTTVDGLAAPDIILVSNATLDIAANADIEQFGKLPGTAQTLTLQGNGALLRVSSDPTAKIVRQGVTGTDTTSLLTIGDGATIRNSSGGAAGALILDSSNLFNISPSTTAPPVLMGQSLTLDAALINLELGTPVTPPTTGLVITAPQLNSLLSSTQSLSLLSYSSIAVYGSGQIGTVANDASGKKTYQESSLALHADDIYYADTQNSSGVTINAQNVSIDNLSGGTALPTLTGLGTSNLTIDAQTISLGSNAMRLDQFSNVALNADGAILLKGLGAASTVADGAPTPASLTVTGSLTMTTPLITSAAAADQTSSAATTDNIDEAITAGGAIVVQAPVNDTVTAPTPGSLAASLSMTGSGITQNSGSIILPSGNLGLTATGVAAGSDVVIGGTLDVGGVAPTFFNLNKFSNGGSINLTSLNGNVTMGSTGSINVAAASGTGTVDSLAGNGGALTVQAGDLFTSGKITGGGGTVTAQGTGTIIAQGNGGGLTLTVGTLDPTGAGNGLVSSVETGMSGFASQSIRDKGDATVTLDGTIKASIFNLSADFGSIDVTGTVNASNLQPGGIGGSIDLAASGSVTLESTAVLSVASSQLNDAGQGGNITLVAGAYEGLPESGVAALNLAGQINLGVGGGAGGTLLLEAPQVSGGAYVAGSVYAPVDVNSAGGGSPIDVAIAPVASGVVRNAGSIVVAGTYVQDAPSATAQIDGMEGNAQANGTAFTNNSSSIASRIFGSQAANVLVVPNEEIDNSLGDLVLASSWDLSTLRYGSSQNIPGILTLRAAGNIDFDFGASLTDGFDTTVNGVSYLDPLMAGGSQSWSYNLTAGADFSAANVNNVLTSSELQTLGLTGSVQIGVQQNPTSPTLLSTSSTDDPAAFFQTIRTGTGNITLNAGGDVLLLNNLATIYTAGSQVDPTLNATFVVPNGTGGAGQILPATYSSGGGNVTIKAQGDIAHLTYDPNGSGQLVADSSPELPTNWLDREGVVSNGQVITPTTWWVDFTNFFEGVGALGGGNATLAAGGSVINVDAAVPTNARDVNGQLTELGGGDLSVTAGSNIDAGVYYVERGQGSLVAGNSILTNSTRTAAILGQPNTSIDELPTTLFLGVGDFTVSSGGDLLLGPVSNPFLLPQSYNNIASRTDTTSELSYFSTYASTDAVNVAALNGTVTLRDFSDDGQGSLYNWYINILDSSPISPTPGREISDSEPWLDLAEAATSPGHVISDFGNEITPAPGSPGNVYGGVGAILPPTLRVTSFSGDIDVVGTLTLFPSATGTIDLVAADSINAFQVNSMSDAGGLLSNWGSGLINLSDANPADLPGINSPLTSGSELSEIVPFFTETGLTQGLVLQTKQDLHADIDGQTLHADDPNPAYIYAGAGDISGLTVFSAKQTQVIAGEDITDIGLYLQNNNADDISIVSAGRDILAYDATSALRQDAGSSLLGFNSSIAPLGGGAGAPNSGDIQISGPGTIEVLAGRNFTLGDDVGANPNNTLPGEGIFSGLTSVGGQLNTTLPFGGANIIAAAGLGSGIPAAGGLDQSSMTFGTFITQFLNPTSTFSSTYLPDVATEMGLANSSNGATWTAFQNLSNANQDAIALDVFYLVLRDAGRNHATTGNYDTGNQAIAALFPASTTFQGNIDLTSREIKTSNGGNIELLAPGGGVTVGVNAPGDQAVDQGVITVQGGDISIFANNDVAVGTSRIFTLSGGNEIIWSSVGNIDAGASSKTVVSAPPTRVIVDPTSGEVQLDLSGLATGGGIGTLETVAGAVAADIDLVAPLGTINAGDAGIRSSGNLNISALKVLNADNIQVGGKSSGVPSAPSVNVGAVAAAAAAAGSSEAAAQNAGPSHQNVAANDQEIPSIITVEVLGYGGSDDD